MLYQNKFNSELVFIREHSSSNGLIFSFRILYKFTRFLHKLSVFK